MIQQIFFELIRVAIGAQNTLTRPPSTEEWKQLYNMAKKQSLLGICFAGVKRLGGGSDSFDSARDRLLPCTINITEILYLKWMGMAAKIQKRNEIVNRQCVTLGERLEANGYRYSILKGQGVANLYKVGVNELEVRDLSLLRQSGDIDVLMWKDGLSERENRKEIVRYAQSIDKVAKASVHHIAVSLFLDTEVEMHYAPAYFCNPFANKRFQQWNNMLKVKVEKPENYEINVPCSEFNLVFLLAHTFRHYISEGVGLRQLMDYYFVLCNTQVRGEKLELRETLLSFNMLKFAGAVMWVMREVFWLPERFMVCEPDETLGRKLLTHVMRGGNFGHHNTETVASKKSHAGRFVNQLVQDLNLAVDYPAEALWAPISMIREFIRIRI